MPRASEAGRSDENDPSETLAVHCGNGGPVSAPMICGDVSSLAFSVARRRGRSQGARPRSGPASPCSHYCPPKTKDAALPRLSPASRELGYVAGQTIDRAPASASASRCAWSRQGRRLGPANDLSLPWPPRALHPPLQKPRSGVGLNVYHRDIPRPRRLPGASWSERSGH
jgi:hypothetical protein